MTDMFHHPVSLVFFLLAAVLVIRRQLTIRARKKSPQHHLNNLYQMVKKKQGLPETVPGDLHGRPAHESEKVYSDESLEINSSLEELVRLLLEKHHTSPEYKRAAVKIFDAVPHDVRRDVSDKAYRTIKAARAEESVPG